MVGNFAFPVFIKNQLVAADDEIKIAAYLFPDFEKHMPETFRSRSKMIQWHFSLARKDFHGLLFRKINKLCGVNFRMGLFFLEVDLGDGTDTGQRG